MPEAVLKMDRMVFMAVLVLTAAFSSGSWAQSPSPASSPSKKSPSAPPPSKKTPPTEPPSPEPAPPPEDPCLAAVYDDLIDCLQYASPDSNETKPTAECCSGVKKYLNDKPQCVCFLLKAPKDLADIVNQTRALKLPSLCKVKIPPIRQCFASSPSPQSPRGPAPATTPSNAFASPPANNSAPLPSSNANPSFLPSTTAFLAGISVVIVAAFL